MENPLIDAMWHVVPGNRTEQRTLEPVEIKCGTRHVCPVRSIEVAEHIVQLHNKNLK